MLADVITSAASWSREYPLLTYEVPTELEAEVRPGQLVALPYGERLVEGMIWFLYPSDVGEGNAPISANLGDRCIQRTEGEAVGTVPCACPPLQHGIVPPIDTPYRSGELASPVCPTRTEAPKPTGTDAFPTETPIRPLSAVLDPVPVLLPHQMELAQWIAEYYNTPLAQVVAMMLPPGLMQRSRMVLRLAEPASQNLDALASSTSPRLRALIGLLLSDGEVNVERLKEMLGPKKAKEILKEARASALINNDAELDPPRTKPRIKRIVRLCAQGEILEDWRRRTEAVLQQHLQIVTPAPIAADNVRRRPGFAEKKRKQAQPNPWDTPDVAGGVATLTLTPQDKEGLRAQRQLAALELLQQDRYSHAPLTPHALCKASGMTPAQLQQLVRENIVVIEQAEIRRDPFLGRSLAASLPLTLTPDQQYALDCIVGPAYQPRPILLHGVTGSGKTEVYLQALAAVIAQGQRGIMLVPEIALTTQAVLRVAGRFPGRVAIIHSGLSEGERYDEWRRIRAGQVDVVIGSRSALLAPVPKLGLIIVDEEHEPAYKQSERRPTYHARETAVVLAALLCIPIVLGSATPSVETYSRAERDAYRLVELAARIGSTLPPVEVVDLRNELQAGNTSIISRRLHEELKRVLERGQQAILFLNRRGAASCILCRDCGYLAICDHCDIPLTYHATERILLCHYCGAQSKVLHFCPSCKSAGMRYFGLGTEKVQEAVQRTFPSARLLRWDRDTARSRHAHEELLDRFERREADILIGTQMIAKGLDLPGVTLVGVVSADIALSLPDFAAAERAFTLLTQVAGRAGRGREPGHVIVQTFNPQHFCIDTASRHDYHEFYRAEIQARQRYGYPPFRRFVKFTYSHENRHRCQNEALLLYERLCAWIDRLQLPDTDIVGPAPALTERTRGKYHWQMIARGPDLRRLVRVIDAPGWEIDIDPVSSL